MDHSISQARTTKINTKHQTSQCNEEELDEGVPKLDEEQLIEDESIYSAFELDIGSVASQGDLNAKKYN